MNTFEPRAMIRYGWETFKKRPWFFIGVFFVISLFSNLSMQTEDSRFAELDGMSMVAMFVAGLALTVVGIIAQMGGIAFSLKANDSPDSAMFKDAWAPNPFWRFVGASILKGLVVGGPLAVAIIVGALSYLGGSMIFLTLAFIAGIPAIVWCIYMAIRLALSEFIVMDQRLMPVEALKESYRMTEGKLGLMIRFFLLAIGVMILGLLALVVGLLVAIPVCAIAYAHLYRTMRSAQQLSSPDKVL